MKNTGWEPCAYQKFIDNSNLIFHLEYDNNLKTWKLTASTEEDFIHLADSADIEELKECAVQFVQFLKHFREYKNE